MKRIISGLLCLLALNISAQDDKTVTLVVSGQGKTQDEAKQNALRSAIEQAFGTFISSETVINNDSFVSENITSLSQGSVISFNILSSNIFPDSNVAITLSATVSISQMQKITESKGYVATIAGGLFGINVKLLKLQAAAEEKVIMDMARKSLIILGSSIDFKLEVIPPIKSDFRNDLQQLLSEGRYSNYWKNTDQLSFNEIYKVRLIVECQSNTNLNVFIDYFISTLEGVKMSESEIDFAKQSGSKYYKLTTTDGINVIYLRNIKSIDIITLLFEYATLNLVNYDIVSNNNIINFTPFYKKDIDVDVSKHYEILSNQKYEGRPSIHILDSFHYVFLHGLLIERNVFPEFRLSENYPCDLDESRWTEDKYEFQLYKTDSDCNLGEKWIYHKAFGGGRSEFYKPSATKNNMNIRYQVFDYYLPLSDVEKLDSIKIIKHDKSSKAN